MASPLLFLIDIYVLLCHPWFLCLGGILNILAWESLCFILFMFLSKECWSDMLSRRLVILYKRWLMFCCPHRVICVWYKVQVYRQWLYYVYVYMYILQLICCFNRFHMYIMYRMDQISRFNLWVFRLRHFGRQEVTWSNWVTKGCAS